MLDLSHQRFLVLGCHLERFCHCYIYKLLRQEVKKAVIARFHFSRGGPGTVVLNDIVMTFSTYESSYDMCQPYDMMMVAVGMSVSNPGFCFSIDHCFKQFKIEAWFPPSSHTSDRGTAPLTAPPTAPPTTPQHFNV